MSQAGIVIVEADTSAAHELKSHLEGFGYVVVGIVQSGSEALQMIEQLRPAIVLMNIKLRGAQDGIQTGSLIHKAHDIPVIYLIDRSSQAAIRQAGTTNPFGYIFKPFDEKQILAATETALIRSQLERKLSQSRQWLNTTLTSIGDAVIATDEGGMIRFINPAATRLTGWPHEKAVEKPLYEVFALADETSQELTSTADIQHMLPRGDSKRGFEGLLRTRDGRLVLVEANLTAIKDANSNVYGMVLVFRDITQQRQATREMQRQAERAEALVHAASQLNAQRDLNLVLKTICEIINQTLKTTGTAVFLLDVEKDVFRNMAVSSKDRSLLAYRENRLGIPTSDLQSLLSREVPVVVIQKEQVRPGTPFHTFFEDGRVRTLAVAALFQGEELLGALISIFVPKQYVLSQDESALLRGLADQASTAIKNAELFEHVRAGRERHRRLAKSLVDIQEAERRRIAAELHDHLGQLLTGLQFMLETLKARGDEALRASLDEIQESVGDVIDQIREMSLNLRPSMLDDMGLVPTLEWHFGRFTRQTGIRVSFHCDGAAGRFTPEIETAAYRIVQEALTNVARYAEVENVFVGISVQEETLWLEILDKGRGFDVTADSERPSSGLSGMRERASLVGGYLTIRAFVNQGTQILAALPLTQKPLERRKYERKGGPAG